MSLISKDKINLTHFVTYMFSASFCCLQFDKANKLVISAFIVSYTEENTVYYIAWVAKNMEIQRDNNVSSGRFL